MRLLVLVLGAVPAQGLGMSCRWCRVGWRTQGSTDTHWNLGQEQPLEVGERDASLLFVWDNDGLRGVLELEAGPGSFGFIEVSFGFIEVSSGLVSARFISE